MKKIPLLFIILIGLQLSALAQKNSIELQTELIGGVPFSSNNLIRPVNTLGINYLRQLHTQVYLIAGGSVMSRNYEDICNNCADGIGGTMSLDHIRVSLGGRYLFRPENKYRFNYFVEGHLLYEDIRTGGQYAGGFSGGSWYYTNDFNGFGVALKGGALMKLSNRCYLASKLAFYRSQGDRNAVQYEGTSYPLGGISNRTFQETVLAMPIELALGFRF